MRGPHPYDKLCFQRTALHYGAKGWELFNLGIPLDSDCQVHTCKTTQFMSESHSPGSDWVCLGLAETRFCVGRDSTNCLVAKTQKLQKIGEVKLRRGGNNSGAFLSPFLSPKSLQGIL